MGMESVCIVGMGTMGSQIGVVCARAGFQTVMVDASAEHVEKGMKRIQDFLEAQENKGKIDKGSADTCLSRISTTTDAEKALARASGSKDGAGSVCVSAVTLQPVLLERAVIKKGEKALTLGSGRLADPAWIFQTSNVLDLYGNLVAVLQINGGTPEGAHAAWSPCQDDVTGKQGEVIGKKCYKIGDSEYHIPCVAVLHNPAVEQAPDS